MPELLRFLISAMLYKYAQKTVSITSTLEGKKKIKNQRKQKTYKDKLMENTES